MKILTIVSLLLLSCQSANELESLQELNQHVQKESSVCEVIIEDSIFRFYHVKEKKDCLQISEDLFNYTKYIKKRYRFGL